jgi:hypothetical protein
MAEARTGKTKPLQPDGALMLGGEQVLSIDAECTLVIHAET